MPRLFTKYTRNVREDFATYLYGQTDTALDDESSATDLLLAASFDCSKLKLYDTKSINVRIVTR